MASNIVSQRTTTVGVGDITLGAAIASYATVSQSYSDGDEVFYALAEGDNREIGVGTYQSAGDKIIRGTIFETMYNGTFDNTSPTPLTLAGAATLGVVSSVQSLTTHVLMWKSLPATIQHSGASYTPPAYGAFQGLLELALFSPTVVNAVGLGFVAGHDIRGSTPLLPIIHWSPTTADTGVVRWGIEYSLANRGVGSFSSTSTIYVEQAATGVINDHMVAEFASTIPSVAPGAIIQARVFRDATHVNDTYTGSAAFQAAMMQYQAGLVGTPSRSPTFDTWG